ncbi:unnamed protein product [Prorocentrum cordatum]|uniref:Uncharacterized protein n=1 Tax=Prorocentrum cordatum TaxID=2364126 RepID=A0ABN9T2J1_9DINO|nr:unnamed protein product [Polarella glacialis]
MSRGRLRRRDGSSTPGRLLVALLAASASGARAARVRAAARLFAGAHGLLDGLRGAPGSAPPSPAEAAAAVVDFFQAGGAGGGGNATAAARPACAGFLARSMGGLNESWSDVQL